MQVWQAEQNVLAILERCCPVYVQYLLQGWSSCRLWVSDSCCFTAYKMIHSLMRLAVPRSKTGYRKLQLYSHQFGCHQTESCFDNHQAVPVMLSPLTLFSKLQQQSNNRFAQ